MLDQLKRMAMQKLAERMLGNSLNAEATSAAAEEGAGSLIESITSKIGGGQLDQVKDLFSQGGANLEDNAIFQNVQSQLAGILQSKGMDAEEAQAEAAATAPDILNGIKDRFTSSDEADSQWNLEGLAGLAGGLAGGNAGDLLGKAKDLLGGLK